MAVDATYLTATLAQLELAGKRGMAGGIWTPENPSNTFVELNESLDVSNIRKGANMCECLLWDPAAVVKCPLSVNATPIEHNFGGAGSSYRGNIYMLSLIGAVMKESQSCVKGLLYDGHGSHTYMKRILQGETRNIPWDDIRRIPWFGTLRFEPLPEHGLPRLPVKLVYDGDEVVWGLPGVCDLSFVRFFFGVNVCQCWKMLMFFYSIGCHFVGSSSGKTFLLARKTTKDTSDGPPVSPCLNSLHSILFMWHHTCGKWKTEVQYNQYRSI